MSTEMNVFVFIWFKLEEHKCIVTLLQLLILLITILKTDKGLYFSWRWNNLKDNDSNKYRCKSLMLKSGIRKSYSLLNPSKNKSYM